MNVLAFTLFLSVCLIQGYGGGNTIDPIGRHNIDETLYRGYLLRKFKEKIPDVLHRWTKFKHSMRLILNQYEDKRRFFLYGKHSIYIEQQNQKNRSYILAENKFTDMSNEEFFKRLGYAPFKIDEIEETEEIPPTVKISALQNFPIPADYNRDWRKHGVVTSVKDQKQCGSCYAFATVAGAESAIAIKTGVLKDLSEQSVVDCSRNYWNQGCRFGYHIHTCQFLMAYRIKEEKDYPYQEREGPCQMDLSKKGNGTLLGYRILLRQDPTLEGLIKKAIVEQGPVILPIHSRQYDFRFYKSGVYDNSDCSIHTDHVLLAVGFQFDKQPYYILKNSWGTTWGEDGYMKLIEFKNMCGICEQPTIPIV